MLLISLLILMVFLGAQIFLRSLVINRPQIFKYFFGAAIVLIFVFLFFQTFQQYQIWLKDDLAKRLLPPYSGIGYFIFYSLTRFFGPYLISLAAGLVFLFSTKIFNQRRGERFFYPEEYYTGALSFFLTGHPGWLFYSVFIIVFYLLIHILLSGFYKLKFRVSPREVRISPRYLWIPAAIFVIIISQWLEILPLWQILKI